MIGTKTKWNMIQVSFTVYPEHTKIIEKILNREYSKPIAHKSASEIVRRAIEHYAMFLGIDFEKIKSEG
ncbi:hypothetical protein [Geoglobus acetivorans]|uniref:Ribbon-helix-helix protein CopG domain-containing protein n=1 Tax=Geoglobus acetivorans TaxID=565033 RepID=A0ABZ3H1L5_GEOAI|nr:hypothetical protein [Geoglobus acetivorans]